MSILAYLQRCREALVAGQWSNLVLCAGNESCDLDSMVSSLAYAHLLSEQLRASGDACGLSLPPLALVLPFWQVERRDIALRPEATWLFRALGMECIASLVFCTDDLADLRARCAASAILMAAGDGNAGGDGGESARHFGGWVLCDHNAPTLAFWPRGDSINGGSAERVWAIVDHHVDAGRHMDACPRIVEMIGSCCSLVCRLYQSDPIGQRLFVSAAASGIAHASDETDVSLQVVTSVSPIAALLLSVVLLDTSGVPSHRADVDAVAHCIGTAAAAAPNVSAAAPVASAQPLAVIDHAALQTLHSRLLRHRRDVLCLTCAELLRKDAKFLLGGGGGVRIGVSSVSLPMRVVAAKADEENRCGQASASAALSDSSAPTEQSDRELRALVGALRRFGDALDIVVLMTVYSRADFPRLAPLPTPAPSDGNTNTGMAPSVDGGSTSGAAPSVSPLVRELLVVCAPAAVERHFGGSAAAWRAWCEALRAALEATAVLQLPGALSFAAHAPVAVVSSSSASSPAPAEAAAASTSAAPVDDSAPIVHLWASQSATATRKQVLPALETFLATRPPPRTVDGSAAVAHL